MLITHIVDQIYYANGDPAEGALKVTWPAFEWSGYTFAAGHKLITIDNGLLDTHLVPSVNALPPFAYAIEWVTFGPTIDAETWNVPETTDTINILRIRQTPPPVQTIPNNGQ